MATIVTVTEHTQSSFNAELETLYNVDPAAEVLYMGTEVEQLPRAAGQQQAQRLYYIAVLKSDL